MTKEQALTLHMGDEVEYGGRRYKIGHIKVSGIAAPYFSLTALGDYPCENLTSYVLVGLPQPTTAERKDS